MEVEENSKIQHSNKSDNLNSCSYDGNYSEAGLKKMELLLKTAPYIPYSSCVLEHIVSNKSLTENEKCFYVICDLLSQIEFNSPRKRGTRSRQISRSLTALATITGMNRSCVFALQRSLADKGYMHLEHGQRDYNHRLQRNILTPTLPENIFKALASEQKTTKSNASHKVEFDKSSIYYARASLDASKMFVRINFQAVRAVFKNKKLKPSSKVLWLYFWFRSLVRYQKDGSIIFHDTVGELEIKTGHSKKTIKSSLTQLAQEHLIEFDSFKKDSCNTRRKEKLVLVIGVVVPGGLSIQERSQVGISIEQNATINCPQNRPLGIKNSYNKNLNNKNKEAAPVDNYDSSSNSSKVENSKKVLSENKEEKSSYSAGSVANPSVSKKSNKATALANLQAIKKIINNNQINKEHVEQRRFPDKNRGEVNLAKRVFSDWVLFQERYSHFSLSEDEQLKMFTGYQRFSAAEKNCLKEIAQQVYHKVIMQATQQGLNSNAEMIQLLKPLQSHERFLYKEYIKKYSCILGDAREGTDSSCGSFKTFGAVVESALQKSAEHLVPEQEQTDIDFVANLVKKCCHTLGAGVVSKVRSYVSKVYHSGNIVGRAAEISLSQLTDEVICFVASWSPDNIDKLKPTDLFDCKLKTAGKILTGKSQHTWGAPAVYTKAHQQQVALNISNERIRYTGTSH